MSEMFKDGMAVPELVNAVRDASMLSQEEASQADALEKDLKSRGMERPVILEAWMLKVSMTGQYSAGVLEKFGVPPDGIKQFYTMYQQDQEERIAGLFPKAGEEGKKQLLLRLQAYDQALHAPRGGDPGREVAALFCRFLGADKENALADFSHDICSELNNTFVRELERLRDAGSEE